MPAPLVRNYYTERFAIAPNQEAFATKINAADHLPTSPSQLIRSNARETLKSPVTISRPPDDVDG